MNRFDNIKQLYNLTETKLKMGYRESTLIELEHRLKATLPRRLKDYYLAFGKDEDINYSHNKLLKPHTEIGFSHDGYLIFYEENQAVVRWGIKEVDLKLDDPPVWGDYGSDELSDWHLEAKTTEDFFLLMAIYNGTLGGLAYNANSCQIVEPKIVKEIKRHWTEISELSWSKQKIFADNFYEEVLSLSFDEEENCTSIFVGTSYKDKFDKMLDTLNIQWSYISTEDDIG